jgi:chemotaxis protein CheD
MGANQVNLTVGVSDAKFSRQSDDVLTTYALGSCIGVALFDPIVCIGGLLHFQLPTSTADTQRSQEKPLMFADTGLEWLMGQMERMGAQRRRFQVRLAGGAKMLNDGGLFDIGRRNHAAIRKLLFQHRMFITAEQVGGIQPRTMMLNIADGAVAIRSGNQTIAM